MSSFDENLDDIVDESTSSYAFESSVNAAKYDGDFQYDSLDVIVHPGWTAMNYEKDWEDDERKDHFLQEFYPQYIQGLEEVFEQSSRTDPVYVIYSEGGKSHANTLIDQLGGAEIVDHTESKEDSGELTEASMSEVLQTLQRVHPDGERKVHGEIEGRCRTVFQEQLEDNTMPDTDIEKGVSFPPEPIWNYVFEANLWHR